MKRLGVVGASIALTMSAVALSSPASAATTTDTLQNYHTGIYLADINPAYRYWTHSTDLSYTVIQNTDTGRCLYNVINTNAVAVGPCSADHRYLWRASSVVSIGGSISYQLKNYHTGACLYGNASGTPYLDACSSNHADYWH